MILYDNLATLGDIPEAVHDKTEKLEYVVNNSNQKIETLETTIKTIYSKNTLNSNLEAKTKEFTMETKFENQSRQSLLVLANFNKIWNDADISRKKALLRTILEKVVVNGDHIEVPFAHN